MFNTLKENIRQLNANINDVATCEKAKNLRNKLLKIGISLTVVGAIGLIICFTLFIAFSFNFNNTNLASFIVPFVLIIPFSITMSIGFMLLQLALRIVVADITTDIINKSLSVVCPNCGDPIGSDEMFCDKCGLQLRIKCPNCDAVNDYSSEFCRKCGASLNKKGQAKTTNDQDAVKEDVIVIEPQENATSSDETQTPTNDDAQHNV